METTVLHSSRLVSKSDVVVQNYRPGVAEKLGVDYASLCLVNPDIIVLSISGFGPTGPYADLRVYDQVVQAMSGVTTIMSDGAGQPAMFHNLIVDKVTSLNAAQAVTAALLAKSQGKGGQNIQLSMMDAAMHFLFPDAYWNKVWPDIAPIATEWREIAQRSTYDASDGRVSISATDARQMWGLLEVTGLTEHRSDSFGKMRAAALEKIRAVLKTMTKQDIFDICQRHGVPCGMFQTLDEALSDPQVRHCGTVEEHVHPEGGRYRASRPPAQFARTPSCVQGPAPLMGVDNAEVLKELGLSTAEVEGLRKEGVI
ncbi:unnamed protein product [Polarella glacialis]|uniref:Formyl-CoA transferase n=1 Tax=Polarella glacialis TaxID=89957 RepID=A0A813GTQ1_POLGL|nr:unnamed protein product [Polarella glacialis]CAE8628724.1 unnamed protein product [Polarella glacialis]